VLYLVERYQALLVVTGHLAPLIGRWSGVDSGAEPSVVKHPRYTLSTRAVRVLAVEDDRGMPTYEYVCKQCGENLEAVQGFQDEPLTVCPNCGGELKKVFGNIGIVFKGSGFYKNDSRSASSGSKKGSSDAAASSGSESKAEASKDSSKSDSSKSDTPKSDSSKSDVSKPSGSSSPPSSSTPKAAAAS
jgi:putative FmdB family regulatory protein